MFSKMHRLELRLMDIVTDNILLDGLCSWKCGGCRVLFSEMVDWGINLNTTTHKSRVAGFCKHRNWKEVLRLLTELELLRIHQNIVTYNTSIDAVCKEGMAT